MKKPEPVEAPEGWFWSVTTKDFDGVRLTVKLCGEHVSDDLEWTWDLTPWDLAKQERIEKRIRACKRALLRKYAENQRIEAAIHAVR
jgi:hypothetical protein